MAFGVIFKLWEFVVIPFPLASRESLHARTACRDLAQAVIIILAQNIEQLRVVHGQTAILSQKIRYVEKRAEFSRSIRTVKLKNFPFSI